MQPENHIFNSVNKPFSMDMYGNPVTAGYFKEDLPNSIRQGNSLKWTFATYVDGLSLLFAVIRWQIVKLPGEPILSHKYPMSSPVG